MMVIAIHLAQVVIALIVPLSSLTGAFAIDAQPRCIGCNAFTGDERHGATGINRLFTLSLWPMHGDCESNYSKSIVLEIVMESASLPCARRHTVSIEAMPLACDLFALS